MHNSLKNSGINFTLEHKNNLKSCQWSYGSLNQIKHWIYKE
jgi:hypothetical protein